MLFSLFSVMIGVSHNISVLRALIIMPARNHEKRYRQYRNSMDSFAYNVNQIL